MLVEKIEELKKLEMQSSDKSKEEVAQLNQEI